MNRLRHILIGMIGLCIVHEARQQRSVNDTGPSTESPPTYVRVDAAIGYNIPGRQYLILFVGDKAQNVINHEGDMIWERTDFGVPPDMNLKAACTRPGEPFYRRFFGDLYGVNVNSATKNNKFKYGPHRKFLKHGGPDAAATWRKVVYFFKGCRMVARKTVTRWGKVKEMSTVGLPCNVDAAWSEDYDEKVIVLKGDQYWVWEPENTATGPHDFHSNYTLKEWTLTPVT